MGIKPDLMLVSKARRCKETAAHLVEQLALSSDIISCKEGVYEASTPELIQLINQIPERHERVLLVGHNPSLANLVKYISGDPIGLFATAGLVRMTFEVGLWAEISGQTGYLLDYLSPY